MPASSSPPRHVKCAKCGEMLAVRAEHAGLQGRCHQCGHIFTIAAAPAPKPLATAAAVKPKAAASSPPAPLSFTFLCSLCRTVLTARVVDVGETVQCPDCRRHNRIPSPPRPVYAPTPAEIAASTPSLHPVPCSLCQTLMYATDTQLGMKLKCPDCGRLTVATPRQVAKPKARATVPDGEEYQLDEQSAPPVHVAAATAMIRPIDFNSPPRKNPAAPAAQVKVAAPKDEPAPRPHPKRPPRPANMPAVPLVQGVLRMMFTSAVLSRWVSLSLVLIIIVKLVSNIANAMGNQALIILPFFAMGLIAMAYWTVSAFSLFLAIITDSSEGNDQLDDLPSWISFEIFESLVVAIAAAVSTVAGWLVAKLAIDAPLETQWVVGAAGWMLAFPFVLLSSLDIGSPLGIFSPRLFASLFRCAGHWLLFYIVSGLLAGAAAYAAVQLLSRPALAMVVIPSLAVATLLVYMRLIGRLAWWIAESTSTFESNAAADD